MEAFWIEGGVPLSGSTAVSGAKNAALPIMAAALLASEPVRLENVPQLRDVETLSQVLQGLGLQVTRLADQALWLETIDHRPVAADYALVRQMRASFCVLGPLLARRGRAVVPLPGGCNIGPRPVDRHLAGLAALGADIEIRHGNVVASARKLRGTRFNLASGSGTTVTGTANLLCAAVLAQGVTVLEGAACEPEIVDLGNFLNALGAQIAGLGTSTLIITGVEQLAGASYSIIADRIEATTLLLAAALTRGQVTVEGARADHLREVLTVLRAAGMHCEIDANSITLTSDSAPRPVDVTALPYPGVPTDLQSQLMALLTLADGQSVVRDHVFPHRFQHVAELNRLGAKITQQGNTAIVQGVQQLTGAPVVASDLRASAALVLAALAAQGVTRIDRVGHLDRGYERLDQKLARLGARVRRGRIGSHTESQRASYGLTSPR